MVFPPSVDRSQNPYCEHPYTLFWFAGSISVSSPSPPTKAFHVPGHDRSALLSCDPPTMRVLSCSLTPTL